MKKKIVSIVFCMLLITITGFSVAEIDENREFLNKNYRTSNFEYPPTTGIFKWPIYHYDLNNTGYSPSLAPDDDTLL